MTNIAAVMQELTSQLFQLNETPDLDLYGYFLTTASEKLTFTNHFFVQTSVSCLLVALVQITNNSLWPLLYVFLKILFAFRKVSFCWIKPNK